jgi:DNA-binding Lrp family transcriptional regulator
MGRGRKPAKELSYRDKKIVERYNSTFVTMPLLAKKYGISKQRVHEILMRAKRFGYITNRPRLSRRDHKIHQCKVCSKILQAAEKDDLITKRQLAQMLNIDDKICNWHLNQLKVSGFIPKMFATIRSDRLIKALQCYKNDSLSPATVGRKFGYKNFYSILIYQKKKGINVERTLKSPMVSKLKQEEEIVRFPSMSQTEF